MSLNLSWMSNFKLQQREVGISQHLPYAFLEESDIVRTKQGDYLAVLKIEGISWDTLEDSELNLAQTLRAQLFATLSDPRFALYYTIIRSRVELPTTEQYDVPLAASLYGAYQENLSNHPLFVNDLYLTIVFKGSGSKGNRVVSRVNQLLTGLSHEINKKQAAQTRAEALKILQETSLRFTSTLEKYNLRRLRSISTEKGFFSEILNFFSRILNWQDQPCLVMESDIGAYLPKRRLFFGHKSIESQGNIEADCHFAAMLSLKNYPANTYPGMLDGLLQLPIEMVVTQSFVFQHSQKTREELELQLRRLYQARDPDQKGIAQLQQALGGVVSGEFGFGSHHLSAMILSDDLEKLEENVAAADKQLAECGIVSVRESLNLEASFWAQFPGNFRYIVRKMPITTNNFAALAALNNDPRGQKSGNHWGDAVTVLRTPANLPYYFNFHKPGSDVGHTLILGMTGSGKTLLVCFLLAMTLKYQARIFYFDKDRGAEAFMRGIGADYVSFGTDQSAALNPLQLPDTRRNRRFLVEWLSSLFSALGQPLTHEELGVVHNAVRLNYEMLQPLQRTLKNLAEAFGVEGPGTLRSRFDAWHSDSHLSEFFSAERDGLQLDNRFYGFEMGALLEQSNAHALPSTLLYLFYRIQLVLEHSSRHMPTIICLDEAWALLDNPIFSQNIKNWLKTFRKRNAIVLLLSQEVTDITQSQISASLHAETATKIFFPDPSPRHEVYSQLFKLTDREIHLLKEYSADRRYFLIRQAHESAFARLDLEGMQQWIPILSSNSDTLKKLDQLIQKYGSDPANWLSFYLEAKS